jgi:uncharacterized membrane protein YoaT (DUF817 family)
MKDFFKINEYILILLFCLFNTIIIDYLCIVTKWKLLSSLPRYSWECIYNSNIQYTLLFGACKLGKQDRYPIS